MTSAKDLARWVGFGHDGVRSKEHSFQVESSTNSSVKKDFPEKATVEMEKIDLICSEKSRETVDKGLLL